MSNVFYIERTSGGSNQISLKSKLLERRIIYLDSQINTESVNEAIQQIALLAAENSSEPITILISSGGGSIIDGLALIDVMRSCPCVIKTVSVGIAASMGCVILAAGTKGHRYITPNSQAMLHQPLIAGNLPGGNCSEIETIANSLIERKNQINNLLVDLTGKSRKHIDELTAKDTYLNAEEAVENGIVDEVATGLTLYELIGGIAQ